MKKAILLIPAFLLICISLYSQESDNKRAFYWDNGNKKSEGHIQGDKKVGVWTFYYENGKKQAEGIYQNGVKYGEWTTFYSSGQEKSNGKYVVSGGKSIKTGTWTTYHKNGAMETQGAYKNGKPVGEWKKWDSSERLVSKKSY